MAGVKQNPAAAKRRRHRAPNLPLNRLIVGEQAVSMVTTALAANVVTRCQELLDDTPPLTPADVAGLLFWHVGNRIGGSAREAVGPAIPLEKQAATVLLAVVPRLLSAAGWVEPPPSLPGAERSVLNGLAAWCGDLSQHLGPNATARIRRIAAALRDRSEVVVALDDLLERARTAHDDLLNDAKRAVARRAKRKGLIPEARITAVDAELYLDGLAAGPRSQRSVVTVGSDGWAEVDGLTLLRRMKRTLGLVARSVPLDLAGEVPFADEPARTFQAQHDAEALIEHVARSERERELALAIAFDADRDGDSPVETARALGMTPNHGRQLRHRMKQRGRL